MVSGLDATPSVSRYHHLDAVRAFALLLGVAFHAAESFGPNNHYWAIVDSSPSQLLEDIRFACHSFRLELFFVIAGFFGRLMVERRGVSAFVANRALRILVPFVVGWVILYPVLVYIWIWGHSVSGKLTEFGVPPEAQQFAVWQLWLGFFMTLGFVQKFDLTHLWFLHQLMALYGILLCTRALGLVSGLSTGVMPIVDKVFGWITRSPFALVFCSVLAVPFLLMMRDWGVDTPKSSLIPELPTTLLFGYCFFLGWLFHRQPVLVERLAGRWAAHLVLGVVFWFLFGFFDWDAIRGMTPGERGRIRLLYTLLYAHMMWAFVLAFLGLFTRFCHKPSAWSRYLADSSYWVYLAHLPVVVALQVVFGRMSLPWPIKYPLILSISTVLLYLSYHFLARGTFIGVVLNGRRYPRIWPWKAQRH
jgi:peptidoglycan/LPS O-acetylase OafA/YrhL